MAIGERRLLVTLLGKLLFARGIAVFAADIADTGQHGHKCVGGPQFITPGRCKSPGCTGRWGRSNPSNTITFAVKHEYSPAGGDTETFEKRVGSTLGNAPRSQGSVAVKLARKLEVSVRTRAEVPRADLLPSGVAGQDAWRNVAQRQLQESCTNGTEVSVSSTAFPDAEGCYLMTDDKMYTSATLDRVIALVPDPDAEDTESLWVTGTVESTSTLYTSRSLFSVTVDDECFSDSFTSSNHPSDVETWNCFLDDATEAVEVSEAELSVACGCFSPAPTAVPTSFPTGLGDGESSCDEAGSVEITSDSAPDLEGNWISQNPAYPPAAMPPYHICYEITGAGYLNGGNYFNRTSSEGEMDLALFPLAYGNGTDARWTLGADAEDIDEISIFCYSEEVVNETHPADASWFCNLNGTSEPFSVMTDDVFAVGCGCSSGTDPDDSDETVGSSPGISLYGTAAISLVVGLAGVLLGAM